MNGGGLQCGAVSRMRSVAIIGSGPAGLVTAKAMLSQGIMPTIYEKYCAVGGMWNPSHPSSAAWADEMRTNLSKYSCLFSDLPWTHYPPPQTTSVSSGSSSSHSSCSFSHPPITPTPTGTTYQENIFPTKAQISQYLFSYYHKYLANIPINFHSEVLQIHPSISSTPSDHEIPVNSSKKWTVKWKDLNHPKDHAFLSTGAGGDDIHTKEFDYVVIATGFFNELSYPKDCAISEEFKGKISHSNEGNHNMNSNNYSNQTVAVIGGSHNAAEMASSIAFSAQKVYHITPRPFWPMPRFLPTNPTSSSSPYLPLDLIFYQRPSQETFQHEVQIKSPEQNRVTYDYLKQFHGSSSQPYSPPPSESSRSLPSVVAISDYYTQMFQSNKIEIVNGRVTRIEPNGDIFSKENDVTPLCSGIDSVVFCTGYQTKFSFFSSDILEILQYRPDDLFVPTLTHRNMIHPQLPGLGFVGMHRGPYFGVMEMQAVCLSLSLLAIIFFLIL
jgi:cation diffusion facilitator CzcD-associated flavoprotein CzcO